MKPENYFSHFDIAGFTYYDGVDVFEQLRVGTQVKLVVEPENRYDRHAVAIYYKDKKLGFIPRNENKMISKLLQFGYEDIFSAKINRISADEHPENQVGVVVKINERK